MQLQINHEPRSFTTAKLQRKFSARVCSACPCQIDLTSCKLCKSNIMDQTLARFASPRRGASRGSGSPFSDLACAAPGRAALRESDPQVKLTRGAGPETTHSVVSRRPRLLGRAWVLHRRSTSQAVHAKLSRRQRASWIRRARGAR